MATLTTQIITRAGTVITPVAAGAAGDAMSPGNNNFLRIVNGQASPITVTLAIPAGVSAFPNTLYANTTVSVTNGTTRDIGPLPTQQYADPVTGLVTITYSSSTTITVAAVALSQP